MKQQGTVCEIVQVACRMGATAKVERQGNDYGGGEFVKVSLFSDADGRRLEAVQRHISAQRLVAKTRLGSLSEIKREIDLASSAVVNVMICGFDDLRFYRVFCG